MNDAAADTTNVRVAVRCRPLNGREKGMNESTCVRINGDQITLLNPANPSEVHSFAFDNVFDQDSLQIRVWERVGAPILQCAFSGYNGTIFAYGQTGSGKTWSMQGGEGDLEGIIPRMNNNLFAQVLQEMRANPSIQHLVTASYFEIYNEVLFDLLDPSNRRNKERSGLEIKEHPVLGVYVKGLQEIVVDSPQKMQALLDQGMASRTTAATQMNADSSRSHSVFTIKIHKKDLSDESKNIFAKVNLVDLAGSERVKSTGATGATLKEGANINKSLSALGNVINALVESGKGKKGVFIPYRNSKLTRVLQESLGGNSITVMLAAMSPAGCNFDETMSTLKYADRAKSIKVKAVKNEEASQISKLNDEIRLLRERLAKEGEGGGGGQVDTSAIEEKHRQQLLELEDAMKSTWEEKARISQEHEVERQRLQKEQEQAVRESKKQRERAWRLLEEKSDLDLSLTHVKEVVKKDAEVLAIVLQWQTSLRELLRLEQELGEQDTVVEVYRTSLQKDSQSLLKNSGLGRNNSVSNAPTQTPRGAGGISIDKSTLSMWRQLKDKFSAIHSEVVKWAKLQDDLKDSVNRFLVLVQDSEQKWIRPEEGAEKLELNETARGFELIVRLVVNKKNQVHNDISKTRAGLVTLSKMAGDMSTMLALYDREVQETTKAVAAEGLNVDPNKGLAKGLSTALAELKECVDRYGKGDARESTTPRSSSSTVEAIAPKNYQVVSSQTSQQTGGKPKGLKAVTGGTEYFSFDPLGNGEYGYAQVNLEASRVITGISIQGAVVGGVPTASTAAATMPAGSDVHSIQLPCGLTLAGCRGDVALTQTALGDVIDWVALLKKNPPEKFLKRPPVRFLFDLVKFVGEQTGLFPQSLVSREWDSIADSKQGKLDFVSEALSFVSSYLGVPAATTPAAIITGADAELTNIFMQHMAIAAYKNKTQSRASASAPPAASRGGAATPAGPCWLTHMRILWSSDGTSFSQEDIQTSLKNPQEIQTCQFKAGPVTAKVIRIQPLRWSGPSPVARFSINATSDSLEESKKSGASQGTRTVIESEQLVSLMTTMKQSAVVFIGALEFLGRVDEARKAKAQEDVKRRMDMLANEKQALEQTLANEKQTLATEKQGLNEKLTMCTKQLRETEQLLNQEQTLRQQLQSLHTQLERDKTELQTSLQQQIDENATHQNELLKLQSSNTRNEMLIETLKRQLQEQETLVAELQAKDEEHIVREQQLESEKEDLTSQLSVVTEERDLARSHEEDLDLQLKLNKEDFEELQESYVATTERCNQFQDDLLELQEKLEDYKNALKQKESLMNNRPMTGKTSVSSSLVTVPTSTLSPRTNGIVVNPISPSHVTKNVPNPGPSTVNPKPPPAPLPAKSTGDDDYEDDDFDD